MAPDIPGEQGKETLPTADILTEVTSVLVGTGSGFPAAAGVQEISRSSWRMNRGTIRHLG
nr:hypothetical protein [uncultured Acetatifactor sp.]